ncbi:MAG: hypothetical protein ACI85O_000448 [Saprospiraceae bacterium]|jgi:hypothetical protein
MSQTNYTFWKLINEHRIEIPIIQRDYAQGRENTKSKDIRENFVAQLHKALSSANETDKLHLNFVYGKVNGRLNATKQAENKAAIKSMLSAVQSYSQNMNLTVSCEIKELENTEQGINATSFIPLDGQQRLTTLYLLHWYLMMRLGKKDKSILENFSYRIRPSSKDFCDGLINEELSFELNDSVSEKIKNTNWFFSFWKKDPTVRGMLNMLDEIHKQFKENSTEDLTDFWEGLTSNEQPSISFEFLDLDDYNLTNELYIKMNARGKSLTEFENFKAWLIEEVGEQKIGTEDWKLKIDTIWADLFWNHRDDANMLIDEEYMRFFRNMTQIHFVMQNSFVSGDQSETTKENTNIAREIATTKGNDGEYILKSNSFYKEHQLFEKENLKEIFSIIELLSQKIEKLDVFENVDFFKSGKSIFKSFISGTMTYPNKVLFYGMMLYLLKNQKDEFYKKNFKSWMRVIQNLIENSTIDSLTTFSSALKGLQELSEYSHDIYNYLAKTDAKISGFGRFQSEEELRKTMLIKDETLNEAEFIEFENHTYFKGQVNFLLELCAANGLINNDKFNDYGQKCAAIFSHKMKNFDDVTFERALFTKGNYLIRPSTNWCFITMQTPQKKHPKPQDWRSKIFIQKIDNEGNLPNQLNILKKLLDSLKVDSWYDGMNELIKNHNITDWSKYFIKFEECIKVCQQRYIRRDNNDETIKLLGSSGTYGYYRELRSYCFYLQNTKLKYGEKNLLLEDTIKPFSEFNELPVIGTNNTACAYLNNFKRGDKFNYAADIYFKNGKFEVKFFNRNETPIEAEVSAILNNINGFETEGKAFTAFLDNEIQTKALLLELCQKLRTLNTSP